MTRMWGKTFAGLFGENAKKITVGNILRMRSGINDFDVPAFNYKMLHYTGNEDPLLLSL